MEAIHGVDISWLHRPANGQGPTSTAPAAPAPKTGSESQVRNASIASNVSNASTASREAPQVDRQEEVSAQPEAQSTTKSAPRRAGLTRRASSEKGSSKSSWMSSLSSKFSSQPQKPGPPSAQSATLRPQNTRGESTPAPVPTSSSNIPINNVQKEAAEEAIDDEQPNPLSSPKSSSFLSSALRRLSSSSGTQGKGQVASGTGGIVPRQVLNVDQARERCTVAGLDQGKLRRVAFRVDVELMGTRHTVDSDPTEKKKKNKDKKMKERGEGEALKHPNQVKEEKEKAGVVQISGEELGTSPPGNDKWGEDDDDWDPSPYDLQGMTRNRYGSAGDEQESANVLTETRSRGNEGPPKTDPPSAPPVDRPTTDPLRAYRRCCQLREAPVLKRISEQLANAQNFGVETPGVVSSLNLNRSRMQLQDVTCLGDWLAIVPVKRLLLEDANLTDDGLRVILAGLLAAKRPQLTRQKRGKSNPGQPREPVRHTSGVIEKLTLKNNRRITAEGWKYICVFLNLSKSVKAIDISMIPFPRASPTDAGFGEQRKISNPNASQDIAQMLYRSLVGRPVSNGLEELLVAECGLSTPQIERITTYAAARGLPRLGLASNHLDKEGLQHVAQYLKSGKCEGIDLGGNDLHGKINTLTSALDGKNPIWALSLANCNLTPKDLEALFPTLVALPDFRLLDIAHNQELFAGSEPTALGLLRKYLPKLPMLKRIQLGDCSMTPAHAIGLAEIIPECRNMAHINVLENTPLKAILVDGVDVAAQEEACAVFASMMTAVRLCKTLLCVDIDVPGPNASELVKALARQVVAYCLTNIERYTEYNAALVNDAAAALPDVSEAEEGLARPEVLKHLLEQAEGVDSEFGNTTARNEDYLVGGTGVAKALSYCLSASQLRRMSVQSSTPTQLMESDVGKATSKQMSRTLLESARHFRESLQPVLVRESASGNFDILRRLQFLDQTLQGMIARFEHEYPDSRLPGATINEPIDTDVEPIDISISPGRSRASSAASAVSRSDLDYGSPLSSISSNDRASRFGWAHGTTLNADSTTPNQRDSLTPTYPTTSSRRGSEVELAARALAIEEGRMHRLGQQFRRQVMPPRGQEDRLHGTSATEPEPEHLQALRAKLEEIGGEELREQINQHGIEAMLQRYSEDAETLRLLECTNPVEFRKFRMEQIAKGA